MVIGVSRTCIGGVLNHQGHAIRFASTSRVVSSFQSGVSLPRLYSTASSTLTKKGPVTAKGTKKDAHLTPPPPKGRVIPPKQLKKTTSAAKEAAVHVVDTPTPIPEPELSPEEQARIDEEEQLKEMERYMAFQHLMPTVDTWGQEVKETLGASPNIVTFMLSRKSNV